MYCASKLKLGSGVLFVWALLSPVTGLLLFVFGLGAMFYFGLLGGLMVFAVFCLLILLMPLRPSD
jgi:hypothetical protein